MPKLLCVGGPSAGCWVDVNDENCVVVADPTSVQCGTFLRGEAPFTAKNGYKTIYQVFVLADNQKQFQFLIPRGSSIENFVEEIKQMYGRSQKSINNLEYRV